MIWNGPLKSESRWCYWDSQAACAGRGSPIHTRISEFPVRLPRLQLKRDPGACGDARRAVLSSEHMCQWSQGVTTEVYTSLIVSPWPLLPHFLSVSWLAFFLSFFFLSSSSSLSPLPLPFPPPSLLLSPPVTIFTFSNWFSDLLDNIFWQRKERICPLFNSFTNEMAFDQLKTPELVGIYFTDWSCGGGQKDVNLYTSKVERLF